MLNKSKDEGQTLPRIQSQKRVQTAFDRKQNSRDVADKKTQPNNRQLKRAFSTTNTCKAVRYQNTGLMYTKKITELENQNENLDKQIKRIEEQITAAKKNNVLQNMRTQIPKQMKPNFITEVTDDTNSKVSIVSRNLNNEKIITSEIKLAENRLALMRKKIDEQSQRNKKMRKEVDDIRKQINTLKELNKNIQNSYQKTSEQFQEYSDLSKTLDEEIANKNALMHKTKIQNQHKKAEMIRQYNEILKCLERELEEENNKDKSSRAQSQYMYVTEYDPKSAKGPEPKSDRNVKFSQISVRKSKLNIPTQISTLKQKLQRYEKQFEEVKTKTGTKTTQQVIKQFQNKYEENFDFYKFINQLYSALQDKQKENEKLRRQRDQQVQEAALTASQAKEQEIKNIKEAMENIKAQKQKYSGMCQNYETSLKEVKQIIYDFYKKVDMGKQVSMNQLSEQNIVKYLVDIREMCRLLDAKYEFEEEKPDNHMTELDLTQMLDNVKRQNNHDNDPRNDRIMSREDFLKSRENLAKKRPTPRKPLSKR